MTHFTKHILICALLIFGVAACAPYETMPQEDDIQIQSENEGESAKGTLLKNILIKTSTSKNQSNFNAQDKLKITILGEDTLSGDYKISDSGSVTMPLIGVFNVTGQSTDEIQDIITRRLQDGFIKDPFVQVMFVKGNPS